MFGLLSIVLSIIAILFVALLIIGCFAIAIFYLPYAFWLANKQLKGECLDIPDNLPTEQAFRNAYIWWKSRFTHKPVL